jgi:hypothetical protein
MPWSAVVFGWPFVALAAALFCAALFSERSWPAFVAAALAAPFCLFVSAYPIPIGRFGGPIALVSNFLSAWLLHRQRRNIAFAFLVPFLAVAAIFALLVIGQSARHHPMSVF